MSLASATFFSIFKCLWTFCQNISYGRRVQGDSPWVKPQWCVPYSSWRRYLATSVTSSQHFQWSLQDDQDDSLWTCKAFKVSRLAFYQYVQWNRWNDSCKHVHLCHALPQCTVLKQVIVCQMMVFMALFSDMLSLRTV